MPRRPPQSPAPRPAAGPWAGGTLAAALLAGGLIAAGWPAGPPAAAQEPATQEAAAQEAAGAAETTAGLEAGTAGPAEPAPAPSRRSALPDPVYTVAIDARLDDEGVIAGRQTLRWQNTSAAPVPDLRFHLYLNAFANDRSTFMRESGGRLRGDDFDKSRWGYVEITRIALQDGTDLTPLAEFLAPDDGNPEDRTVVRYPLPEPVPPGGFVQVEIEFESRLPDVFARTGVHGDYVLAGQWYPKIAVWEEAGMRGRREAGWNAHQFHAHSEFYADFGDYLVTLTLPERYRGRIGATGRRIELAGAGDAAAGGGEEGTVTVTFAQDGVHDFAWTADPEFEVVRDRFDPARDVPAEERRRWAAVLGVPEEELALPPVDVELFLRPENRRIGPRYMESAKAAIRGYGLRLGAYPYPTLTMVDPAWGAMGSGGMEYPTFITLAAHPLLGLPPLDQALAPELVTVHEYGHQYFQGMIASNEFEESWLDEGINSYYEMEVMEDYARWAARLPGIRAWSPFEMQRTSISGGGFSDPVAAPSWRFRNSESYGLNSYPRPAITLRHLENLLGEETFHRAMREFFQTWRFRHPSTADFEETFSAAAGRDLGWFFDQALRSTRALDYSVRRLDNRRLGEPEGFFWRGGERLELEGEEDEENDDDERGRRWESVAEVFREGEFVHPVTVEFRFEDGRTVRREWDGESRWVRWRFRGPAKLAAVEVDPDDLLALDVDRVDNGRTADADPAPALAIVTDVLYWLTSLFHAAALFA